MSRPQPVERQRLRQLCRGPESTFEFEEDYLIGYVPLVEGALTETLCNTLRLLQSRVLVTTENLGTL